MVGLGDLFGKGSIGEQFLLWNVGSQVASAGLAPFLQSLTNKVNQLDPSVPLSPEILADLANRALMDSGTAASHAAESGISGDSFKALQAAAEHAADLSLVMEGVRRKTLAEGGTGPGVASLENALKDSGVQEQYWPTVKALLTQIPTVSEVMNAWLQGQIEEGEANRRYLEAGGDPTWFQTSYNANGSAPSPNEAATMANRGIIGWDGTGPSAVTFEQAFLEGPWRNKWEPAWRKLAEYLPPPRTVTALQKEGVITQAEALTLYKRTGLSAELAAAYVKSASLTKTATEHALTKADVITLYKDRLISDAECVSMLEALNYSAADAAYIVAMADFQREAHLLTASVSKIHTLYVTHKITKANASASLTTLQVPAAQVEDIFKHWDLEKSVNVKALTEAQIVSAWDDELITQTEAESELAAIGYNAFDAWVLLSIKAKKAQPGKPARSPGQIGIN